MASRTGTGIRTGIARQVRVRLIVKMTFFIVVFMYGLVWLGQWLTRLVLQYADFPLALQLIPLTISILLGGAGAHLIIRLLIERPLAQLLSLAESLGRGDLTARATVQTGDEFEQVATRFNGAAGTLQQLLRQMGNAAAGLATSAVRLNESVSSTSQSTRRMAAEMAEMVEVARVLDRDSADSQRALGDVDSGIEQVAQGAGNQSAQMQGMAATLQGLIDQLEEMVKASADVNRAAVGAAGDAATGAKVIQVSLDAARQVAELIGGVDAHLAALQENSSRVGQINTMISDIADQTNMLALNAAIEAARAGEQGRGFAVVADEVRQLAQRSQDAAGQIEALIRSVQEQVATVMDSNQRLRSEADRGANQASAGGVALQSITTQMEQVVRSASQMTEMAKSVRVAGRTVGEAVQTVAALGEENAAATEEMAAGAAQLSHSFQQVRTHSQRSLSQIQAVHAEIQAIEQTVRAVAQVGDQTQATADEVRRLVGRFLT